MIAKFDKSPLKIAQIYSNLPIFTQKIQKSRPKKTTFNKACYNFRVIFAFVLFYENLRPLSVGFSSFCAQCLNLKQNKHYLKFKEFKRKTHAQCENFAPNDTARLKSKKAQQRQKNKRQIFKNKKCKKANFKAKARKQQKGLANGDLQF